MSSELERLRQAVAERYAVERELGRGGMATVYLAQDLKHGRSVAIKVLSEELTAIGAERFSREIQVSARLNHPHVVPVHDSGRSNGLLYYVMAYMEGETLRQRLERERQLPFEDVVSITNDVAMALGYAHKQGVLHRDVKPENIMLSGGSAVVADFGIARALSNATSDKLTGTGIVLGTPAYMSPEQAFGEQHITERSDVYSLGCVVYEMLAGMSPFAGTSSAAIVARHATDPVPRVRTVRPTLPPETERVLKKALAKAPDDRYASTQEFAQALQVALQPAITGAARGIAGGRTRRLTRIAAFALLAVAFASIAVVVSQWRRGGQSGAPSAPVLAVLAFDHVGRADDSYLADGITDEITTRLGHISGLSVIARSSALQYDPRSTSLEEIARELGAQWLLTGTIRTERVGDAGAIRVTPRLISATNDRANVWEQVFDAAITPGAIIKTQSEIAERVAAELDIALLQRERLALDERPTEDAQAYDAFLRGSNFASRPFSEEPTRKAIEQFERAAQFDSTFLLAYAKLAEVESQYFYFFDRSPNRRLRVERALNRALALDSNHVAAQVARGYYLYWTVGDINRAIAEFERVRQSQSNNSQLLYVMGSALRRAGRWQEALARYERALALNPRSQQIVTDLGSTHMVLRNFAQAEHYLNRASELAPDWILPYVMKGHLHLSRSGDIDSVRLALLEGANKAGQAQTMSFLVNRLRYLLGVAGAPVTDSLANITLRRMPLDSLQYYLAKGRWHATSNRQALARAYYDSARTVGEGRMQIRGNDPDLHVDLGFAYAALGRKPDAEREAQRAIQLLGSPRDAYFGALTMGWASVIYMNTGNADSALAILTELLRVPSSHTPAMLRSSPWFDPLRSDPRFRALLQ